MQILLPGQRIHRAVLYFIGLMLAEDSLMPFKFHVGYRAAPVFVSVICALLLVAGNDVGLAAEQSPFLSR